MTAASRRVAPARRGHPGELVMKSNKNTGAHRWFCWVAALAAPLMLGGCQAKQGPVAPGDPNTGGGYPITVSDPGDQGYNAPPHHFNPRQHPPRNRPGAPPPPDLASLPKLVNHIDQCYGRSREPAIASGGTTPADTWKLHDRACQKGHVEACAMMAQPSDDAGLVSSVAPGRSTRRGSRSNTWYAATSTG